ncbi:DUF4194 domain-containing protein [Arthrobacter alpinus]|nr:DUF4194 domain-containing protein [Arthrobacter alpinus]
MSTERTLFPGDTGSFPLDMRQALVRLLRGPYIDGTADPALWTTILTHAVSLQQYLSEIFLLLSVDTERKIALLAPAEMDAVHTQPIVARKPLRREETLLALRLRVLLDRHAGSGTDVSISRDGAREILAEHRQPGAVDDKRMDEQTDAALARLLNLKLILPTELPTNTGSATPWHWRCRSIPLNRFRPIWPPWMRAPRTNPLIWTLTTPMIRTNLCRRSSK